MDIEKYPHYFLIVIIIYAVLFLAGIGYFVLPSLGYGFVYADFYLITVFLFLPLILLALYTKIQEDFFGKFRLAITALTIVDFILVLYMMILLI